MPLEISVDDAARFRAAGQPIHWIDVREPHEHAIARIEGADLVPMRSVPGELQELERRAESATLLVFCHHGVRSLNVVNWLRGQGVENCTSLAGGIDAWSLRADPTVPRY